MKTFIFQFEFDVMTLTVPVIDVDEAMARFRAVRLIEQAARSLFFDVNRRAQVIESAKVKVI